MTRQSDIVIIGSGPAGLTAAIYCSRAGLKTVVLEKAVVGGQILKADVIENYPGFPDGISAYELMEYMKRQAERFGCEIVSEEAVSLNSRPEAHGVATIQGNSHSSKAVIIATGANPKELGIKGESELTGKGVSYCATCDGPLFKNKEVVVIGGGDAAIGEAIYLTRFASRVFVVHRRDKLRASGILQQRLLNNPKIEVKWSCVAAEILGEDRVRGIKINNLKDGKTEEVSASGIFMYVGIRPNTDFLKNGGVNLDDNGFIITDEQMRTSVKGIFACGDVRKNTLKQVITACGEGALAANSCWQYLEGMV
jgi:thioredoxin reductase (NADPH)